MNEVAKAAIATLGKQHLNPNAVGRYVQAFHEGYYDMLPGQRRSDDVIEFYEAGCRARSYDGKETD